MDANTHSRYYQISQGGSSHPDRIELRMDDDGHQLWGFVIYRTTYDSASDRDWPEFLRRIRWWVEYEMEDEDEAPRNLEGAIVLLLLVFEATPAPVSSTTAVACM